MKMKLILLGICFSLTGIFRVQAQDMLVATKVSPRASVTQRIGTTDITVVYHSPSAKKRKIFGGIIPYDFIVDGVEYPWRAGSNENTTIEFTHDVQVQGQPLAKGKYGLHIFVREKEWTFIFSNKSDNWGSFSYKKEQDALRVTAVPENTAYQENLNYAFVRRQPQSTRLELHWSRIKCGIEISTDVNSNILTDLKAKEEKTVDDYVKIAQLTASGDNKNIPEALNYLEKSFTLEKGFRNLMLKANLLAEQGKKEESNKLQQQAIEAGKGFPYFYYYPLSFMLLDGDANKTNTILSEMLRTEPDNWIANLAMGEYYIKANDQEKATLHFEKAYQHAGERSKNYTRYMYLSNKLILEQ